MRHFFAEQRRRVKGRRDPIYRVPRGGGLFPRYFCIVVDKVSEKTESRTSSPSPEGDRKGPHPAPHRPRPYNDTSQCDTPLVVIVRAGAVWSGVGTLAVALLVGLLAPLSLPFACDVE